MNTITIELPGIEAKLDRIIELLEKGTTHDCERCANSVATVFGEALGQTPAPVEDPAEKAEPVEEPAKKDQPTVSRADIQKKVVALSAAGKKDQVKQIVTAYENTKVSDIPEDKLIEVFEKLTALEG